jgi:putative DNA primase/helicase
LNGIGTLVDRAYLADRALTVHLRTIAEHQRQTEAALLRDFEHVRPRVLGALLDAISAGLRKIGEVKLKTYPRLADFAEFITAAEPGLGWDRGSFLACEANRRDVSDATVEADVVAMSIQRFITAADFFDGWRGSATDLLACAGKGLLLSASIPAHGKSPSFRRSTQYHVIEA